MMNANEAKKMVATYIENEAQTLVEKIETQIVETATNGFSRATFYFPVGCREDIRIRVLAEVKEAGYDVKWGETTYQLNIYWGK